MISINRQGVTRTVILTNRHAIKFPTLRYGWARFLCGLLSNMDEALWARGAEQFSLCPTIFSVPGGWMNIQPRCQPLTDGEWRDISAGTDASNHEWQGMHCDFQRANFGTLSGDIVLLDYGQVTVPALETRVAA